MYTVLVVDDDQQIVDILEKYLTAAGFAVSKAYDGTTAVTEAINSVPDIMVLDLMLPAKSGFEVLEEVRRNCDIPVIMLTARDEEAQKLQGLKGGADDYMTKPFSPRELVARIEAVLRRTGSSRKPLSFGRLSIFPVTKQVRFDGVEVKLTPAEYKILFALARNKELPLSRDQLIEQAFGPDFRGFDRTVDAHIKNLRRKLEPDPAHPAYIVTVYGFGYKLTEPKGENGNE